jgi:fermentation-respiration switch protein FrsA (DUF1100 family)
MILLAIGLAFAVLLYGIVLGGLYAFQRNLLYRPEANLPPPETLGLADIAVLRFAADDGNPLFAWYAAPARMDDYVVLYLHGNAGHIGYRAHRLHRMVVLGWGVFLLEYRGFGGNPGQPTEQGLLRDARAGLAELQGLGVPLSRILLWGESLGTGLAIDLAAENAVAAVLLESPYTSIAETAQVHYPYVPARRMIKDKFDSLSRISRVTAPILVMQGARDRIVPPAMGRTLLRAATAPSALWVAEDAGHNDLAQAGAIEAAAAFVRDRVPGTAR